jgi:phosphatidylglycerophosphate synthase
MRAVHNIMPAGLVAQGALLAALTGLTGAVGLGRSGWLVGTSSGLEVKLAVARGLRRIGAALPGPADLFTLTRATMSCAVAGLVADGFRRKPAGPALCSLTCGALLLDAVDGWVARRTGSATAFGARFDGEVDAFLILTLSVQAGRSFGPWVLPAGIARYAFAAAGRALPWLRRPLPPRYWRKVATATEGVALAAALTTVLPRWLTAAGLAAGSAMIAESFGRDVWWLWLRRAAAVSA